MIIRRKQMEVLARSQRRQFKNRLEAYVRKRFSETAAALGEPALHDAIRAGIA